MAFLEIDNIRKVFVAPNGQETVALNGLSFSLEEGEILSIVGHNGSGKTTLLNCLRQSFPLDGGDVRINGKRLDNQTLRIVSVYQDVCAGIVPSMTPVENLSLIFSQEPGFLSSIPTRKYRKEISDMIDASPWAERIRSFQNTPVVNLSGGQRQQLAIFMAMMRRPDVLLLDEFIASLDQEVRDEILEWTKEWIRTNNVTTLIVTHDRELAQSWSDRILELQNGNLLSDSPTGSVGAGSA